VSAEDLVGGLVGIAGAVADLPWAMAEGSAQDIVTAVGGRNAEGQSVSTGRRVWAGVNAAAMFLPVGRLTGTLERAAKSGLNLASDARKLIQGAKNEYFLGVVENGNVRLFNTAAGQLEHHGQLIQQGLVQPGAQGFSIAVKEGEVVAIRLNSQLNTTLPGFNLPKPTAEQILKQLGAPNAKILGN
jgi:hypothetical protein